MADDWRGEYVKAVVIADGLGDMLESIVVKTVGFMDWIVAAPQRLDEWRRWNESRPPI
jgi:hypothetical protein